MKQDKSIQLVEPNQKRIQVQYYLKHEMLDDLHNVKGFAQKCKMVNEELDVQKLRGMIGVRDKKKVNSVKRIFPRDVNVEYVTWSDFEKSLTGKNHLTIEIRRNHLIYGNVFKVVEVYSGCL